MKNYKRIHIIGRAGSGKTYTSRKLAEILNVQATELDELFWEVGRNDYSKHTDSELRDRNLHNLLNHDSWILEGVYHDWVAESFQRADLIIFIRSSFILSTLRIVLRYLKIRVGIISHGRKETFSGLIETIKRNKNDHNVYTNEILKFLTPHRDKLQYFNKGEIAVSYFRSRNKF